MAENALRPGSPPAKREYLYLELLRTLAIFIVMFIHSSAWARLLGTLSPGSAVRWLCTALASIDSIAVPLFFMISGALLLGRNESIAQLFKKRVLKIALVLLLISLFYYFYYGMNGEGGFHYIYFLRLLYSRNIIAPLWYLYAYLGFLLMLPLLRPMAQNMKRQHFIYFFAACIAVNCLQPILESFVLGEDFPLNEELMLPLFTTRIAACSLMGYYLHNRADSRRLGGGRLALIISAAVPAPFLGAGLTALRCAALGDYSVDQALYFQGLFSMVTAPALFLGLRLLFQRHSPGPGLRKLLLFTGSCSFGIYLFESFLRDITRPIYTALLPSAGIFLSSLLWIACAFVLGLILVGILKHIPVIKKLI